jgi:hypothetical protein
MAEKVGIEPGAAHRAAEQEMLDGMAGKARPKSEDIEPFKRLPGERKVPPEEFGLIEDEAHIRRARELREWHGQDRPPRPSRK